MIKTIACDDGSTGVKLALCLDGEVKSVRVSNRAIHGRAASFGYEPDIYSCESNVYTFDEKSDAIPTSNISYQYSAQASCAIQHALLTSGFVEPKDEVNLIVTLPIAEFFDADNRPNVKNINAKKSMVMRTVVPEKYAPVIIKEVKVMPEGIPAALNSLRDDKGRALHSDIDLVLIADIGGTTLDLCLMRGIATSIVKVGSYSTGMVEVHKNRQKLLGYDNLPPAHTDRVLQGIDSCNKIELAIEPVMNKAIGEINDFVSSYPLDHIVCVGAGAGTLAKKINEHRVTTYSHVKTITVANNAEFALAEAIVEIEEAKHHE
ncbi:plasmid segregation protein ParM domain-containing protein [Vibrio sp. 10N.261.46.A3]|uniref:plasmid segregation protein ParM domain-containing protein n=1 Tax=Vibrio sp. 10N.261.46.A3 TaxID=3229658 RepID=UPI00354DD6ED